LITSCTGTDF